MCFQFALSCQHHIHNSQLTHFNLCVTHLIMFHSLPNHSMLIQFPHSQLCLSLSRIYISTFLCIFFPSNKWTGINCYEYFLSSLSPLFLILLSSTLTQEGKLLWKFKSKCFYQSVFETKNLLCIYIDCSDARTMIYSLGTTNTLIC